MPPWIVEALSKLSPEGSAGSFLGSLATLIALVIVRVMQERKKLDKAMQSIPPTVCPVPDKPDEGTVIATARRFWQLEQELSDLRARLTTLDADRKAVSADAVRTAVALAESERRGELLAQDNARLIKALEGARLPVPVTHVDVTEVDDRPIEDRPTPQTGKRRK